MRDAFSLDPTIAHLNHGSFGAVPRIVAERQRKARAEAEANPMRHFRVDSPELKAQAREVAAEFLGVGADELGLLRNVTQASATVLSGLVWQGRLGAGDVVLLGEQGYEAVRRTVAHWCERSGATYETVSFPLDSDERQVVAAYRDGLDRVAGRGATVRLVLVDQITSPTASVLPARGVCSVAHEAGALVFVDAAHAPGHVPARPADVGADFWTGTWHKWGFAPRGTSALWAAEPERESLLPLTTSWNHGEPFPLPFDTHGTDDYSAWYSLETALAFWADAGGLDIGVRSAALLDKAAAVVDASIAGTGLPRADVALPFEGAPCMRLVPLPDGVAVTEEASDEVYEALSARRVEAQVVPYGGRGWLRLSCTVYNEPADYERLADVLPEVLRRR